MSLFDNIVYLTISEAKQSSILGSLSDEAISSLVTNAQWAIDGYIGYYGIKFDSDQDFIFPLLVDGLEQAIPNDIKMATIRTAEMIHLEGNSLASMKGEKVTGESNQSRSINYSDKQSYKEYVRSISIPKKALGILNKYRNNFTGMVI